MTKKEMEELVKWLKRICGDFAALTALFEDGMAHPDEAAAKDQTPQEPARVYTYEEVRAILAEKARSGFRAEVKALLTRRGVSQLSEVKDPEMLAAIAEEASML